MTRFDVVIKFFSCFLTTTIDHSLLKCTLITFLGHIHNQDIQKRIAKNYFEILLYLLFHDYNGLVYDCN
jgi:hypothetical protein